MRRSLLPAVLSLSVLISALVAAQDASYTFTTFDVPSSITTVAYGINTVGQIVGSHRDAALPGGPNRGFLTADGGATSRTRTATLASRRPNTAAGRRLRGRRDTAYSSSRVGFGFSAGRLD